MRVVLLALWMANSTAWAADPAVEGAGSEARPSEEVDEADVAKVHHVRLYTRLGTPSLLGLQAEVLLPIEQGPGVSLAASYGFAPRVIEGVPSIHSMGLQSRLYARADGAAFFVALGVGEISMTSKPGELGQSFEAGNAVNPEANDQSWGRPKARLSTVLPSLTFGTVADVHGFIVGVEMGAAFATSGRLRQAFPQVGLVGGVVPCINVQLGAGF